MMRWLRGSLWAESLCLGGRAPSHHCSPAHHSLLQRSRPGASGVLQTKAAQPGPLRSSSCVLSPTWAWWEAWAWPPQMTLLAWQSTAGAPGGFCGQPPGHEGGGRATALFLSLSYFLPFPVAEPQAGAQRILL